MIYKFFELGMVSTVEMYILNSIFFHMLIMEGILEHDKSIIIESIF